MGRPTGKTLEAWRFGDPADVIERQQLQERASTRKIMNSAMDQVRQRERDQADRQLILDRLFRRVSR